VEIQDESSQLVTALVDCREGDVVVDLCSGAGGKALAVLPRLGPEGHLVTHDPREAALRRSARRFERAGTANVQRPSVSTTSTPSGLEPFEGRADWVLVDAPCSNTGSLRHHPECKYRLFESPAGTAEFERLLHTQRRLLQQARRLLRRGGAIVYSTCSILPSENEEQVHWAEAELGLESCPGAFTGCFPPLREGRDGFFAAVLR